METKFRPIPITILDFLGVLVPGFLWLVLATETYSALEPGAAATYGPMEAWRRLSALAASGGGWIGPLALVFASLVAGYALKPLAMNSAGLLARPLFWLRRETRKAAWSSLVFPYRDLFAKGELLGKIEQILKAATGVKTIGELPGRQPFSAAKRYLRAAAPTLWEESERMEAEVRMAGALFLAALYSAAFHLLLLAWGYAAGGLWAIFSSLIAFALGFGFNTLRVREVGYTYLNLLLAEGLRERIAARSSEKSAGSGGDD